MARVALSALFSSLFYHVYRHTHYYIYRHEKKEAYMKVIVSIDSKIIMSIDTINVVYMGMKKRNLREGYCVYRHKDYYVYTHNNSQPERDTACSVGR